MMMITIPPAFEELIQENSEAIEQGADELVRDRQTETHAVIVLRSPCFGGHLSKIYTASFEALTGPKGPPLSQDQRRAIAEKANPASVLVLIADKELGPAFLVLERDPRILLLEEEALEAKGQVRVNICPACAATLRKERDAHGEQAMASIIPKTLCESCLAQVPPALRLVMQEGRVESRMKARK